MTLIIETVIYIFLKAYEYYPRIIPNSPKNDGVIGNIFSQFSISTVTLFICVLDISFYGAVLAGTMFYLIEKLFLALGIYQTYWYRPWITLIALTLLFQTVKKWYKIAFKSNSQVIQYITTLLAVISLYLPTTNWLGILSGLYDIKEDILIDPFISHAVIAIPKYLIQINIVYFLYKYKANWIWNLAAVAVILTGDAILYYTNLMHVKEGWLLIYSCISISTTYLYIFIIDKLLYPKSSL
ncbi:MAG: hypothetical protein N2645_00255 [Clostridia bacterium]|nr:hypothetical protein [Clostridia bacterium]